MEDNRIENNGMYKEGQESMKPAMEEKYKEGQESRDKYFMPILAEKDKELEAKDKQNTVLNNENTALKKFIEEHGFSLDEVPGLN